ncbi:MAG: acyltransferase family protein [Patescibacteria group bacterium]
MSKIFLNTDLLLFSRFLASLFVIRQHLGFPNITINIIGNSHFLLGTSSSGTYSVTFFFILSGYLMAKILDLKYLYELSVNNLKQFYVNRIARILPLYLIIVIVSSWIYFPYTIELFNKDSLYKLYLILTMQYQVDFFVYNQVIWSIGPEVLFYFLSPILYILFSKFMNNIYLSFLLLINSFILIQNNYLLFIYKSILDKTIFSDKINKYLPGLEFFLTYFSLFMIGFFGYFVVKKLYLKVSYFTINKNETLNMFKFYLSIISFYFLITFDWGKLQKEIYLQIFSILTLLLITLIEMFDFEIFKKPNTFFNNLGNLSYGIYLVHMLILIRFNELYTLKIESIVPKPLGYIVTFIIVSILSILISNFLYKSIELPLGKKLKSFLIGVAPVKQ